MSVNSNRFPRSSRLSIERTKKGDANFYQRQEFTRQQSKTNTNNNWEGHETLSTSFIFAYDDKNVNKNNAQKMKTDREVEHLKKFKMPCVLVRLLPAFSKRGFPAGGGDDVRATYPREELERKRNKYVIGDFR